MSTKNTEIFKYIPKELLLSFNELNTRNLIIISDANELFRANTNLLSNLDNKSLENSKISKENEIFFEFQNKYKWHYYTCKSCLTCIGWSAISSNENLNFYENKIILYKNY